MENEAKKNAKALKEKGSPQAPAAVPSNFKSDWPEAPEWAERVPANQKSVMAQSYIEATFVDTFVPGHSQRLRAADRTHLASRKARPGAAFPGLLVVGALGGGGKTTLMHSMWGADPLRGASVYAIADEAVDEQLLAWTNEPVLSSEDGTAVRLLHLYSSCLQALSDALRAPAGSRCYIDGGRYLMWNTNGPLGRFGIPANLGLALTAIHNAAVRAQVGIVLSLNPSWPDEGHEANFRALLNDSAFSWVLIHGSTRRELEYVSRFDRRSRWFHWDAEVPKDFRDALLDPVVFSSVDQKNGVEPRQQELSAAHYPGRRYVESGEELIIKISDDIGDDTLIDDATYNNGDE